MTRPAPFAHTAALGTSSRRPAAELRYGVARLANGRRKKILTSKVGELLTEDFADQVLPFGGDAAAHYAQIAASRELGGRPISMADAQIAAICRNHGARLATRNTRDFADTGIHVLNPWVEPGSPS